MLIGCSTAPRCCSLTNHLRATCPFQFHFCLSHQMKEQSARRLTSAPPQSAAKRYEHQRRYDGGRERRQRKRIIIT